ncbi:MAG: Fic family protein [Candidatus Methanoperedens sp.]|jgi:Fic family protein|nr:Fic family protein [Candidatus Methanoperedens sp.]PKL54367.1 MAG: Fic family protein [Candidatus Methanoperedenaceae archaeon HGW-Methanoperedenaceae-1]
MYRPKFIITNKINNYLLEIERARGFLDAAQLKGDWINEMQSAALILEAHHSTHIEGTELTLSEAQNILAGKTVEGVRPDDRQELLNYKDAMDFVSEYLDRKSGITEEIIKDIHRILVTDVRDGSLEPGSYRKVQNYVANSLTGEIIYKPPSPDEVRELMKEFVEWLNEKKDISAILMAGVAQHRFVDIHPFLDGNGRTARVLCTLILYQNGYDFKRLFSLSEFYDKNRREYYNAIQKVRESGLDMTGWLEYFVGGLKNQMLEVRIKGEEVIKKEIILENAVKAGLNDRQKKALVYLTGNPGITRAEYVKLNDVSIRTSNYDLEVMEKLGFIERTGVGRAIKYRILQVG